MEISAIGKFLSAAVSVGAGLRASKRNFCRDEGSETVPLRFNRLFAETKAPTQATLPLRAPSLARKSPQAGPLLNAQGLAAENRLVARSILPSPPRSPAQTGISRFNANRPELAAICARILSLQSAD